MKKLSIVVVATALLSSTLFAKSSEKGASELKMSACGVTRVAFMKELNEAFSKKFNVKIPMNKKGGDLFVLSGVHKKEADIGSGCRDTLKDVENEKKTWSTQVAWGALSFIVHKNNKVKDISKDKIKRVLLGEIKNWKELGGADKPIHLVTRKDKHSGIGVILRELLFDNREQDLSKSAKLVKSSGFVREAVGADENAFAVDNVISSAKDKKIKMLKVDGIEATKANILADKYKMRQALYLYLDEKPKDLAQKYVNFALSEEGQAIISKTGTANLEEATGKGDAENLIFQDLQFGVKTQ
jgi:phosphate transport system substrate-binding protein